MKRDPFYRDIVARLGGELDPDSFEECAVSLLRPAFPTIVPIRGGNDAGMDGGIADGEGRAFPLVVTTSRDGIGNLTRNLTRYRDAGGPRRKAIFATSRPVTPAARRRLEARAEELDFVLVQVYDQSAIAPLLYRNPEWCRELLNLEGLPPALSEFPASLRVSIGGPLVGRDDDLRWLASLAADGLLVGQPGCGKTAILRQLAEKGFGLFVVSSDSARVIEEIRRRQPTRLILDDAHAQLDLLSDILTFRLSSGARFSVLAATWPGARDHLALKMGLVESRVNNLRLLTRDEIVEVVHAAGVAGPTGLVTEIVNQAEGRPGLATTLAQICVAEGVRDVALADALSRDIRLAFQTLVGDQAVLMLACLAVGGDDGMRLAGVASALGLALVDATLAATQLAAGGVLLEGASGRLTVRPPRLGQALVRDLLFSPGRSELLAAVLEQASPESAAITLLAARALGAAVPLPLIQPLLDQSGPEAWRALASAGEFEARHALRKRPDLLFALARFGLLNAPEHYLEPLLDAAVGDARELHNTLDHPLRLIEDWAGGSHPTADPVRRRKLVIRVSRRWYHAGGDAVVFARCLKIGLDPGFETGESDPGSGNKFTLTHGLLFEQQLEELRLLWAEIIPDLGSLPAIAWKFVIDGFEEWVYPGRSNPRGVPGDVAALCQSLVSSLGPQIALAASEHPGALHRLRGRRRGKERRLAITLPPDFEDLFPDDPFDAARWGTIEARQNSRARALAAKWARSDPQLTATRLSFLDREAREVGISYPRLTPTVAEFVAEGATDPATWGAALMTADASADLVTPFVRSAIERQPRRLWEPMLQECMAPGRWQYVGIQVLLTVPQFPEDLIEACVRGLSGYENLVFHYAWQNRICDDVLVAITKCESVDVAAAAAVGAWNGNRGRCESSPFRRSWRRAILAKSDDDSHLDHWMDLIFRSDSSLAHDWLRRRLKSDQLLTLFDISHQPPVNGAVQALDLEGRRCVLSVVPDSWGQSVLAAALVDGDPELYRSLLRDPSRPGLYLAPLAGRPDAQWAKLAAVAISEGHSFDDIVHAADGESRAFSGPESGYWSSWEAAFRSLEEHEDPEVAELAGKGTALAHQRRQKALSREREESIRGE